MVGNVNEITEFLKGRIKRKPLVGMITGTGLDSVTDSMDTEQEIPYKEIPNFPQSTIPGHAGKLLFGTVARKYAIAMKGRFHIYEGYQISDVTLPVRVMANLGVKYLFISSAAGGLNPDLKPGELMAIADHINLTAHNPLIGRNSEESGTRFPDMTSAYDNGLLLSAINEAKKEGINLTRGTYIGITGPSLETPAETRFFRSIGGDAIGMSTVNEVIEAVHYGLKVLAIVAITNVNLPDSMKKISLEEVIENAGKASTAIKILFSGIIKGLVND
jgi:purine-nucleoside phosphorylase